MASTSAHFNLTKPATTDYYNIGVFNDNTDIIDTQMYNNQVSAAKIMVGATANDDGESGRVPVPHAGDQNKYLCADGTWKTVGGGGGSSVTITPTLSSGTKIADYSIDGVNNSLYAPSGGGGGSYTETILFDNQGGSAPATITLLDDYTNYNMLVFVLLRSADGRQYKYEVPYLVSSLNVGDSIQLVSYDEYASYDITNVTTLTQVNANDMYLDTVVGISY